MLGRRLVGLESREKGLERPRIGVVENNPQIALGRDGEQPVVQDVGAPEVAVGIEGDAVDEARRCPRARRSRAG